MYVMLYRNIICAPMTQVSDAALAIAADKAGIVGSISCPGRDFIWAENEIKKFIKSKIL